MRLASALLTMALAFGGLAFPAGTVVAAEAQPTRLSLSLPLTVPPETTGLISAENLEKYTSPTGILTRRLNAVINQPVAIGLDPMILASIRILGNTAPQSAQDWLTRLQDATNEIFALSYADSDIAALSQAGNPSILGPTSFVIDPELYPLEEAQPESPGPSITPTPDQTVPPVEPEIPTLETITDWPYTIDSLLWPRENTVVAGDLAAFNAENETTTILGSGNVTESGSASGSVNDAAVLVSDDTISQLIRRAVHSLTAVEWQTWIDQLAATLATHPGGAATLLATFDRTPIDRFNRLAETVAAIALLPNVELTSLSDTLDEAPRAMGLADQPVESDRISRMRLLLASEALVGPFSTVLDDPTALTGEQRLSLMALTSNSWAGSAADWTAVVDQWLENANKILTAVQIAESSPLNFFQDKGTLPIAISNGLPYPITVYVTVRSTTGILVVMNSRVPLAMEANSQSRVFIPVQSIANGEASLNVSLSSATRVPLGTPKTVTTNVVAGWETTATFIIAVLLLLLFIAGIVRTVLKRRKALASEKEAAESMIQEPGE